MKRSSNVVCEQLRSSDHRHGTALVWTMTYVTLTTLLLALSGTTLQMVFNTLRLDQTSANDLKSLRDLDVALRRDADVASEIRVTDSSLEFNGDARVVWSIDRHQIIRSESHAGTPESHGVRRFRQGTQFRLADNGDSFVSLKMFPPLPGRPVSVSADRTVTDDDRRVELLLAVPRQDDVSARQAEEPSE